MLANIYLHYVLDLWFEKQVKPRLEGRAMLIRYADDFVIAFQFQRDAERFYRVLPKRLNKFGLSVAEDKTRLIRFSRFQPGRKRSFQFLGFEFYWDVDFHKAPRLMRRIAPKKQREALSAFYGWIRQMRSRPLRDWMPVLRRKLQGSGTTTAYLTIAEALNGCTVIYLHSLFKWLNRRSQRKSYNWYGLNRC